MISAVILYFQQVAYEQWLEATSKLIEMQIRKGVDPQNIRVGTFSGVGCVLFISVPLDFALIWWVLSIILEK